MSLLPLPSIPSNETEQTEANNMSSNPRSLQELLTFSTKVTEARNEVENEVPPLDLNDDRMQFLRRVMSELHVDHVNVMRNYVSLLDRIEHESAPEKKLHDAITELADLVECIDMANLFYELGGLEKTIPLLDDKHSSLIRNDAARLIFQCCQNNIFCQQRSTNDQVFLPLMRLAYADSTDSARFAISAVMAIVQNNSPGLELFHKYIGVGMVVNAIYSTNYTILCKGLHFMAVLMASDNKSREEMIKLNVVDRLIKTLKDPNNHDRAILLEFVLDNLVKLAELPEAVDKCKIKRYELNDFLAKLIQERKSDDMYNEVVDLAHVLQLQMECSDV